MLLATVPASHDTDGTVYDTILIARSRKLKQGETGQFWSCAASVGIT